MMLFYHVVFLTTSAYTISLRAVFAKDASNLTDWTLHCSCS
jgi:hypothetical protein